MYSIGTTLRVKFGLYFHYGISDGNGNVIHNSKKNKKVILESIDRFREGKKIEKSEINSNDLHGAFLIAKGYIGFPYKLFTKNCEHFVRLVHGLDPQSPQLQKFILMTVGAGIFALSKSSVGKFAGSAITLGALVTSKEKSPIKNATIAGLIGFGIGFLAKNFKE